MRRGELYWMTPPGEKRRPAVVVSPDFINSVRDRVLVAPCTSQRIDVVSLTEIVLDLSVLPKRSKVQCQDMLTVVKEILEGPIGSLDAVGLRRLNRAVSVATGLNG